jgi:hypothetical protein
MKQVTKHTGKGGSRFYLIEGSEVRHPNVTSITNTLDKPALIGWAEGMGIIETANQLTKEYHEQGSESFSELMHNLHSWINNTKQKPTTKNAPPFISEIVGISHRKKEAAADIGTQTHEIIERILKGEIGIVVPDYLKSTIDSFAAWYSQAGIDSVLHSELPVVSEKYGYGGTIDIVFKMQDGTTLICDWKTSNGLYKETSLQIAAYRQAYIEMVDHKPSDSIINAGAVRLGKDYPAFEYRAVTQLDECLTGFLSCMGIRRWIADMKGTQWNR